MSGSGDSQRRQRVIDEAAMARFVEAFRGGASVKDAAAAGGFAPNSFYRKARLDPAFRAAWDEAHEVSAAAERRRPTPGEERAAPANRRVLGRRKMRHVKFSEKRQQVFLSHFCWSADVIAAAAEAGVCDRTVYNRRRIDPQFAELYEEGLHQAYGRLEAEALRQRLEAQSRLRTAMEQSEPGEAPLPADMAAEFDRVMKLLARWDRKPRRPVRSALEPGGGRPWTFDSAMALLDKRLKALGLRVPPLPPEVAARYDLAGRGDEGDGDEGDGDEGDGDEGDGDEGDGEGDDWDEDGGADADDWGWPEDRP